MKYRESLFPEATGHNERRGLQCVYLYINVDLLKCSTNSDRKFGF